MSIAVFKLLASWNTFPVYGKGWFRWMGVQILDDNQMSFTFQDTLLVLEALTTYAFRETYRDIYQMEIELVATKNPNWHHTVRLNKTNFATLYAFNVRNKIIKLRNLTAAKFCTMTKYSQVFLFCCKYHFKQIIQLSIVYHFK